MQILYFNTPEEYYAYLRGYMPEIKGKEVTKECSKKKVKNENKSKSK